MAKKQKRRSQGRIAAPQVRTSAGGSAARPAGAAPTAAAQVSVPQRATDLANEYRYVLGDLKRIGILAAAMFALLIALALAAQYLL